MGVNFQEWQLILEKARQQPGAPGSRPFFGRLPGPNPRRLGFAFCNECLGRCALCKLVCGILSSLLHVAADIAAAMSWRSYSYASQSISELFAIGSPTRWIFALVPYTTLVTAFGIDVWWSAGRKRAVRTTAILLVAYGIVSHVGSYFPMHLRGTTSSFTDTMHILLTIAGCLESPRRFAVLFRCEPFLPA